MHFYVLKQQTIYYKSLPAYIIMPAGYHNRHTSGRSTELELNNNAHKQRNVRHASVPSRPGARQSQACVQSLIVPVDLPDNVHACVNVHVHSKKDC